MRGRSAIVVGAGIAGLTAATELARRGVDVRVVEAAGRVGGRTTTDEVDGFVVDRGAQFLSTAYSTVGALVREVGLEGQLRETTRRAAVVRDGRPRRIRVGAALVRGAVREARRLLPLRGAAVGDYSAWERLDDEDADVWCRRTLGGRAADLLLGPVVEGFYFQPLAGTSRALPLALGLIAARRGRALTLRGGIGTLPEALAARLDVAVGLPVEAVEPAGRGARVHAGGATLECDRVVLAIPAPAARRVYAATTPVERELLGTAYSSTIVLALATAPEWRPPPALRGSYGLLFSRDERRLVAAVGFESHKGRDRVPEGELLAVMAAGSAAADLLAAPDGEVAARLVDELERHLPGVGAGARFSRCYRWPEALPCSPPGRSRAIAAYRRNLPRGAPVVLAGDYLGMPFVEGAAESGRWAAERVAAAPT